MEGCVEIVNSVVIRFVTLGNKLCGLFLAKELARIFHKGRRERPEKAMNARNSVKRSADILKYFEESFLRCNAAGMVFSGLAADHL